MRELAPECFNKPIGSRLPAAAWIEQGATARTGQQRKRLVIEVKSRVVDATVQINGRDDSSVVLRKSLVQKIKRISAGLAPGSVPAEPPRFAVAKCLSARKDVDCFQSG
jgi:hypothetical protein